MTDALLLLLLAVVAGISVPTQAGINAQLSHALHTPVWASLASFAVGTLTLVLYAGLTRLPLPGIAAVAGAPAWSWCGGILGAFFVTATIYLAPKLGATTMLALLLTGQMGASLVLDHFGWLGFPLQPVSPARLLGVALVVAGALLIRGQG